MHISPKHRAILKKPWVAVLVGVIFLALCFAIQVEMVRILPPNP